MAWQRQFSSKRMNWKATSVLTAARNTNNRAKIFWQKSNDFNKNSAIPLVISNVGDSEATFHRTRQALRDGVSSLRCHPASCKSRLIGQGNMIEFNGSSTSFCLCQIIFPYKRNDYSLLSIDRHIAAQHVAHRAVDFAFFNGFTFLFHFFNKTKYMLR